MTKSKWPPALALLLAALHSPPALASDPAGLITALGLIFVVFPWTLVCVLAFAAIGLGGRYRDHARAVRHAKFGAIGPVLGVAIFLVELSINGGSPRIGAVDIAGVLGLLAVATAFTSLPLGIHKLFHAN